MSRRRRRITASTGESVVTDLQHLHCVLTGGTKMRALYQRKQGRDLFDLAIALKHSAVDPPRVVGAFSQYMRQEENQVPRAQFEENLFFKLRDPEFHADIGPLLALQENPWDATGEAAAVSSRLLELLPGEPWKGKAE